MNACVGDNGGPYDLFDYGRGFFDGGHSIVRAARNRTAPVDLLVYPAAFSYRHAIELYLKHLVTLLNSILDTQKTFKKNHKMLNIWNDVAELNGATKTDLLEKEKIERAGKLIGYFDAFDPTGQVFRYPEDIKGNQHLAEHKLINVEVLQGQMEELQDILETWVYRAMNYRESQRER